MTEPGKQPPRGERNRDELRLDKETIQDLDVQEQDADRVKGGASAACDDPATRTKPPTTV
jgi:hypothetical protein